MSYQEVLRDIEARGLSLSLAGGDLRLQGLRDRIDQHLVNRIKEFKPELIEHLGHLTPYPPGSFPLTPLQHGYLLGRSGVFEISTASHVYHEIEGVWDLDRLEAALREVVGRHDALRSTFSEDGRQVVAAPQEAGPLLERLDLRGRPPAEQRATRLALREERSHRLLPADRAPLLRADVLILADDLMVLQVGHDGLVMDGISSFLFFRAWWQAYQGTPETGGELPLEDYVAALEAARAKAPAERSRAYWARRLEELPPHPDLPLASSPAAITTPRFTQRQIRLAAPAWAALKDRAKRAALTPSALLMAAYAEVLSRWGAGDSFTLNTTVANRPPIHHRVLEAIGPFSDTMLVEVGIDRALCFEDRARALQARLRTALDHRHHSGVEVQRELGRRRGGPAEARMPFTFNSAIGYALEEVDGSALELFGPEVFTVSQTPQVWLNAFAMEQHGALVVQLDGLDELFPEGLLDDLGRGYQTLLELLAEEPAWQRTGFDLLPVEQRRRRREANDTQVPLPDRMLQDAFTAQALRTPDAPALITSQGAVSYGELHRRASHAAAWLRERGAGRDELVALVMRRGPEQIVGILAAVLAGAAYLPVDAALPEERRRYMLRDGRVRLVLTNAGWQDDQGREVLALDLAQPAPPGPPVHLDPLPGAHPDDLAYVLYTSGTTGDPKGVMVSHRSVANLVADCHTRFGIGPADRFFAISAFNFDLSVWDVFGALSAGAALVLPDGDKAVDPAHWLRRCESAGVTVWNSVPAIVGLMHDQAVAERTAPPALRLVMMSGDRLPPALPAALRRLRPGLEVVSLGGPTETTVWNILHPVGVEEDGAESIPYGRPNANNRAYVLDAHGQDAPDWVTGEIVAAGAGLARGYWGDEQRTAERFFHDPQRGERLYRTGDLGRYLPSGEIAILGRSDFQIKVNGYRIEAGEVETRLAAQAGVRQAVVVRQAGARGDRLVAHLVPEGAARPTVRELRERLRGELPDYMIPSAVLWHEELPLTRNGKVDRGELVRRVPAAEEAAQTPADDSPPTQTELALSAIWSQILRGVAVSPQDNLYALGGDSIGAARILTAVRKTFGVGIAIDRIAELETVRLMAAHIDAARAGSEAGR